MKKLVIAMMMGVAALSADAQVNVRMQTACNPQDVKSYDTQRLRSSFMMDNVMVADQINLTYSMYDRFVFGGAVPVTKELALETFDALKAPYFLFNRELGVVNIGGEGSGVVEVVVDVGKKGGGIEGHVTSATNTTPLGFAVATHGKFELDAQGEHVLGPEVIAGCQSATKGELAVGIHAKATHAVAAVHCSRVLYGHQELGSKVHAACSG